MTPYEFFKYVERNCRHHGVRVIKSKTAVIYPETTDTVSGYFCPYDKKIVFKFHGEPVETWMSTLVHEFSHFLQWVDNTKAWQRTKLSAMEKKMYADYEDVFAVLFDWIDHELELDPDKVEDFANRVMECELEAEKMAAELIETLYLTLNLSEYIQKANSYAYFYKYIAKKREWYPPNKAPYMVETVWKAMPENFNSIRYNKPVSNKYIRLYDFLYK